MIAGLVAERADAPPLVRNRCGRPHSLAPLGLFPPAHVHLPHHLFIDGVGFPLRQIALIHNRYDDGIREPVDGVF
jgi:hypothetical protein